MSPVAHTVAAADPAGGQALSLERPIEQLPTAVIVRQATRFDRPAIATFIEEAYPAHAKYKAARRWTWQFIENPFGRRGDDVPVWVAVDEGRVVGQIGVQRALLQVDGKTLEVGWAVDIMLLEAYRGMGLGHRLHDAVARHVEILLALTMADASRRMAQRQGCVTLADVPQLTRWARLDAASVRRYLLARTAYHRVAHAAARLSCSLLALHRLVPRLVNPLLALRDRRTRSTRRDADTSIAEIERFGPEFDDLWERTRGDYAAIVPRDARFLNWRFVDCPEPTYRRFVATRGGQLVGYVVLRRAEPVELQQGIIVDLYASRRDLRTVDELVRHSLAFFGNDVPAVDCGTSVPEFEAVLRKHGFFRTRAYHPTCVCQDPALHDRFKQLASAWFLSKGDHDWDQVHVIDPTAIAR